MSSFGLAHLKKEGCAIHPDELECELTDEQYAKQARRYIEDTGDTAAYFCRWELLKYNVQD